MKAFPQKLCNILNDYSYFPLIPAPQRRFLMHQILDQDAGAKEHLYYVAQEDTAAEFLESETEITTKNSLSRTKLPDVWQVRTKNGDVLLLYTTQKLKDNIQYLRYPEGIHLRRNGFYVEAKPSNESWRQKPFMELSAGQALPDWSLGLFFYKGDRDPFAAAEKQQRTIYLWTSILGIAAMGILVGMVGRYQIRQMRLTRLKNDFVATVTHELKTPLASMRLLTDTLLEGRYRDETQVRDYLELIGKENHRLSRLIDNFLTFSRMERNKRIFDFRKVHPADIVNAAIESVHEKVSAEGFELKINLEPNLPEIVADRDGLVTVLINLFDNAFKYSESEKWIGVHVYADKAMVCFEVTDRGLGMSRREMKNIFERFYQVDQRLSRKVGGCGLGLSIVKFIVDAHGGEIDVTSERMLGSRFGVKIPVLLENHS